MKLLDILTFRQAISTIVSASEAQKLTTTIIEGGSSIDNIEPLKAILKELSSMSHSRELRFRALDKDAIAVLSTIGDIVSRPYTYNIVEGVFTYT